MVVIRWSGTSTEVFRTITRKEKEFSIAIIRVGQYQNIE